MIFESFVEPAYNFRMTDMQAAMGRTTARAPARRSSPRGGRSPNATAPALDDHPVLVPPRELPWMRANFQSYPLRIRPDARLSQVEIMQHLLDHGVASRRGVGNAHMEPAYANTRLVLRARALRCRAAPPGPLPAPAPLRRGARRTPS